MSTERQQDEEYTNTPVIDSASIATDESTEKNLKPLYFHDPKNLQIPENEIRPEDIQIIYPSVLDFSVISISLCLCVSCRSSTYPSYQTSKADDEVFGIIAMSKPLKQRPTYIGLISASEFFATAVAPLLGGALTSNLSWRWCFYINIPIAAAPAAILLFFLKLPTQVATRHMSQREKLRDLDSLGFTFFAPTVLCLLLALQWVGSAYAWSNARIVALFILSPFILSPILFGTFCFIQSRKQERDMLPPYIIMKSAIAVASIQDTVFPFQLLVLSPSTIFQYGSRQFEALHHFHRRSIRSYKLIMVPATQTILDPSDMTIGMAIKSFSQDTGAALFISIAQAIFLNRLVSNLRERVPLLNPSDIVQLGATNIYGAIPPQDLTGVKISYNQAVKSAIRTKSTA
ncbi:hypothetical protein EAF00_006965 [Botryotinia globosa]|nr:hypothetical protein EAF00_006965 [Botryotinia globosa]